MIRSKNCMRNISISILSLSLRAIRHIGLWHCLSIHFCLLLKLLPSPQLQSTTATQLLAFRLQPFSFMLFLVDQVSSLWPPLQCRNAVFFPILPHDMSDLIPSSASVLITCSVHSCNDLGATLFSVRVLCICVGKRPASLLLFSWVSRPGSHTSKLLLQSFSTIEVSSSCQFR